MKTDIPNASPAVGADRHTMTATRETLEDHTAVADPDGGAVRLLADQPPGLD